MTKNHFTKLFISALVISMLIIGWSVQANYNLNTYSDTPLTDDLANDLANPQDEDINPLVTSCDNPFFDNSFVPVGTNPRVVAFGDFNKDSNLDFATDNLDSNTVSIRLGDGKGGFTSAADVAVGLNPRSVAIGDINNDGKLDLVVPNAGNNNVSIRLGNGDGTFITPPPPDVPVGTEPRIIALGDFNNDGKLDFVTANSGTTTISIRLGNGNGGFTSPTTPEVFGGNGPFGAALGDFNKDGKLDMAVTSGSGIIIELGNGNGSFSTASPILAGGVSVDVGDINNDGKLDFATSDTNSKVTIGLGNGNGSFNIVSTVGVGGLPSAVVLADINNDANLDLSTANSITNNVSIKLGNGTGSFPGFNAVRTVVGLSPQAIAVADINNDSNLDFVATNRDSNNVSIRLGNGAAGFTSPITPQITVGTSPQGIAIADINNDGNLDFAVANQGSNNVSIRLGDGNGGFISAATSEVIVGTGPRGLALGDINNDGKLDFVAANYNFDNSSISIRLGNGNGGFISPTTSEVNTPGLNPQFLTVADFNSDGNLDFAVSSQSNNVSIRLGNGNGGFTSPTTPEVSVGFTPTSIATGDFNSDGNLDFVTTNTGSNTVSLVLGNCQGAQKIFQDIAGTPQTTATNTAFGVNFSAKATNAGTPVIGANVTFTAPITGASGTFAGGTNVVTATTDAAGIVTAPTFTANGIAGNYNVIAKINIGGSDYILPFSLTNLTCSTISLSPSNLPDGAPGIVYSQTITANGGKSPYRFSVMTGALPAGLTLTNTGLISGTPTVNGTGTYDFTIAATDTNNCVVAQSYTISIICPVITITPTSLPDGSNGTPYTQTLTASGGKAPYSFGLHGSLPGGLTLSNSGFISGTPSASGLFNFTVTVQDGNGCSGSTTYSLNIITPQSAITSFTPTSVAVNGSITINGMNLLNPTAVKLNNTPVPAANIQAISDNQLIVKVPSGTTSGKITITTAFGTVVSTNSFTIVSAPTLTSFVPSTGATIGQSIKINGTNLNFSPIVLFANNQLATITNATSTQLTVTIPDGAVIGTVQVISAGLTRTSSSVYKIIPRVDDFNPKTITKGTTPAIVITGKSFTGATTVKFGTISVTPNPVNVTDTQITVNAPANAVTGTISVVTPSGTGISTASLTVVTPPSITTVSPGSGVVGTTVTINGATLTGVTVTFAGNDTPVPATILSGATATSLRVIVPVGAVTGNITVSNAAGSATRLFTVTNGIGSFTPSSGSVGTTVTLTGSGFTGATNVMFGTVSTTNFTVVSDSQIDVKVPTVANGNLTIKVVTAAGTFSSATTFTVKNGIGSFSPGSGSIGTQVVITGSGFSTATRVMFGNGSTTTFISKTVNQITVAVPNNATTGVIKVTAGAVTYTSTDTFTVQ